MVRSSTCQVPGGAPRRTRTTQVALLIDRDTGEIGHGCGEPTHIGGVGACGLEAQPMEAQPRPLTPDVLEQLAEALLHRGLQQLAGGAGQGP